MPQGVAPGHFVGPGGIQKVAGEGAQFGAVEIGLVVKHHRVPSRLGVHAPTDMGNGVSLAVTPGSKVAAHQVGVQPGAGDVGHEVVFNRERHRFVQVTFEGQVHVALVHHQAAIHTAPGRKGQAQTTGPVRDAARARGVTPAATHGGANQADVEMRAGQRRHRHCLRVFQALHAGFDFGLERRVRQATLEYLGVFVRHHQNPRPAGQNLRQLGGMQQTLHGQVCYKNRS